MPVDHVDTDTALFLERIAFGGEASPQQEQRLADAEKGRATAEMSSDSAAGEGQAVEEVVRRLAHSFARAIVAALQNLEKNRTEELGAMQQSLRRLAEAVSQQSGMNVEARESCARLATEIESVRQADAGHEAAMALLRRETQDVSRAVSDRMKALLGGLQSQQEELLALRSAVGDVPPRVAAIVERLDRQGGAIRSLLEVQERRNAALREFSEALTSLKASLAGAAAAPAGDL